MGFEVREEGKEKVQRESFYFIEIGERKLKEEGDEEFFKFG